LAVLLTLSQTALAQVTPGRRGGHVGGQIGGRAGTLIPRGDMPGMRRRVPGVFAGPLRSGFARDGFRRRFDNGFLGGPLLGPVGFGFPQRGRHLFGFHHGLGFFGFPHRHVGFFCFDGFCFFNRFAFVDRFPFFRGFTHRRFGPFGPHGFPVGAAPLGFVPLWFGSAFPYAPAAYATDTVGARETRRVPDILPTLGRQLAVSGVAPGAGDSLIVERVSLMDVVPASVLRLTWRSSGLEAAEVALFLADTAQAVLAAQTLRAPPFTALLEPSPGTAYAGVTAVWPDGTTTSRLVPYRVRTR
jgi:hypothetical protein